MQFLIGLVLLGLVVAYWPFFLVIAVIGMIVKFATKSSQPTPPMPSKSRPSSSSTAAQSVTVEYSVNRSVDRSHSRGTSEIQWASPQSAIEVATYRIQNPMTYWAAGKTLIAEASCIEKHLPVGEPVHEAKGALGYWPRYENMTPGQRANYLTWLASGKKEPLDDIGYAFVYFYGLERRVLVDGRDAETIIPEVLRLLSLYPESGSFQGYLSQFVAYVVARSNLRTLSGDAFGGYFEHTLLPQYNASLLAVILSWFYQNEQPLPPNWAYEVAKQDVRMPRSVVIERAPNEFRSLFMQKYQEAFPVGFKLRVAARETLVEYRPASPSLLEMTYSSNSWSPVRLPHVLGIQSQFKPFVDIWTKCVEELRSYSHVLAKGTAPTTRRAYESLPVSLRREADHPDLPKWESVGSSYSRDDGLSLVPICALAEIQGLEVREKLTRTQSQALARTAEEVGFAVIPDSRYTGRAYTWSEQVALIRSTRAISSNKDDGYHAAACILELGIAVAAADGDVDHEESRLIKDFLEHQFGLSYEDGRRLEVYTTLLRENPPSVASVCRRLREILSPEQRLVVGEFVVGLAAANGSVDRQEASALKTTFKALEIDQAALDTLLTAIRSSPERPVEVHASKRETRMGETLPERRAPAAIMINQEALTRIMTETAEVSRILGDALREDASEVPMEPAILEILQVEVEDSHAPALPALPFSDEQIAALDPRYREPLAELLTKDEWPVDSLKELARRHGLMLSGMLDALNAWADESLGDYLIEEGQTFKVYKPLRSEVTHD